MKKIIACLMLLAVVCSFVACGNSTAEETKSSETETKEAVSEKETKMEEVSSGKNGDTIKIGVIYPTTGTSAAIGLTCQQACQMAAEIINNSYDFDMPLASTEGIPSLENRKIELVLADTQSDPAYGQSEAERLITQEGCIAIVGCFNSSVGVTISQVCQQYEIPFIDADCASKSLSLNQEGYEWHFRTGFVETATAEGYFDYLDALCEKGEEIHTIALVYQNNEQGVNSADSQRVLAEERGYEIVLEVPYAESATDVTSEARKIKEASPDVVIHATYVSDAILYTEAYKKLDYNPKMLLACSGGFTTPQYLEAVGSDGNYYSCLDTWSISLGDTKELVTQVNDLYKSMFGDDQNMDGVNARSFNAMVVLCEAIERAASTNNQDIYNALLETDIDQSELITAFGCKFDPESHDNIEATLLMTQIIEGEYVVVWPFEAAGTEYVYPIPAWNER